MRRRSGREVLQANENRLIGAAEVSVPIGEALQRKKVGVLVREIKRSIFLHYLDAKRGHENGTALGDVSIQFAVEAEALLRLFQTFFSSSCTVGVVHDDKEVNLLLDEHSQVLQPHLLVAVRLRVQLLHAVGQALEGVAEDVRQQRHVLPVLTRRELVSKSKSKSKISSFF